MDEMRSWLSQDALQTTSRIVHLEFAAAWARKLPLHDATSKRSDCKSTSPCIHADLTLSSISKAVDHSMDSSPQGQVMLQAKASAEQNQGQNEVDVGCKRESVSSLVMAHR